MSGGPFSEALSNLTSLSQYTAQLLYKCASDPSSGPEPSRPHLPPATLAGLHSMLGGTFARNGRAPCPLLPCCCHPLHRLRGASCPSDGVVLVGNMREVALFRLQDKLYSQDIWVDGVYKGSKSIR